MLITVILIQRETPSISGSPQRVKRRFVIDEETTSNKQPKGSDKNYISPIKNITIYETDRYMVRNNMKNHTKS